MEEKKLIVTTIFALANGMHRSWISEEFKNLVGEEIRRPHHAAKHALKQMAQIDSRNGWSDEHVHMLLRLFIESM